ncbi:MAG: toll/interleukin-1 receptor domain-containing protein, partial [Nannocystaceae bacterium]
MPDGPDDLLRADVQSAQAIETRAPVVFCSYGGLDREIVTETAAWLRRSGVDARIDVWDVRGGDSFVTWINRILLDADQVLVFLSGTTPERKWTLAEIEAVTTLRVEDGKRVLPILLEPDAPIPPLLSTISPRSIDDKDGILDAILDRSDAPVLGPPPPVVHTRSLVVSLTAAAGETIDIELREGDETIARADGIRLRPSLRASYGDFLRRELKAPVRSPAERDRLAFGQALSTLGEDLAAAVLPGPVGEALRARLDAATVHERFELAFESANPVLLGLPFEVLRLGPADVLALRDGVTLLRRWPAGTVPEGSPDSPPGPPPGPLKILVAVGAPDEGKTASQVLDLERELEVIFAALEPARVSANAQIEVLEVGGP